MKKLKRIISPLAKKQLKELKDFNQILYGTSRANQIYFSIKDCLHLWNSSETGKVTLYNRTYFRLGL